MVRIQYYNFFCIYERGAKEKKPHETGSCISFPPIILYIINPQQLGGMEIRLHEKINYWSHSFYYKMIKNVTNIEK